MSEERFPEDGFYFHWGDFKIGATGTRGIIAALAFAFAVLFAWHFGWL